MNPSDIQSQKLSQSLECSTIMSIASIKLARSRVSEGEQCWYMFDWAHLVLFGFFVAVEVLSPTHLLTLFLKASAESMLSLVGHLAVGVDGAAISEISHVYTRPCSDKARHHIGPINEGSVGHQVRMLRPVKSSMCNT